LDIQTRSDIADKTHVSGDIGLISSRLFIEQPLVDDKVSVWLSGRRTYVDQVMKAVGENVPYFFYDLNGKVIYQPSTRDNVQFSFYGGEDYLDFFRDRNNDGDGVTTSFQSGNNSQVIQWNRNWLNGWRSDLSLVRTAYRYNIRNSFEDNELLAVSDIEDVGAKLAFHRDTIGENGALKIGTDWIRHRVSPTVINTAGFFSEFLASSTSEGREAHEFAAYAQYEWSPVERWRINAGIRGSLTKVENKVYYYPEP